MKKFSLALVASAMALAISTGAWATTACSAASIITTPRISVGAFTFDFALCQSHNPARISPGAGTGNAAGTTASTADTIIWNSDVTTRPSDSVQRHLEVRNGPVTIDNDYNGFTVD